FDGAITVTVLDPKDRAFIFDVTFHTRHPRLQGLPKPPEHFHLYQDEYMEVLEGTLVVEADGEESLIRQGDAEFVVKKGVNHRLYPPRNSADSTEEQRKLAEKEDKVRFLLSGEETPNPFKLDLVFFENWYAYQELLVIHGVKPDIIQILSMFDAGDSYVTLPWWVPFRSTVSQVLGVVVGRWIGGLLGYQPFFREWTAEWDLACEKMENSIFQSKFSERRKGL
ncbi:hypothetical protein QBC35DRAFT_394304, partial [Podospora australis]